MSTDVVFLLTSSTGAFYQCADNANHWTLTQNSGVNSQTVSYAAVMGDAGKTIVMNGSGLTLTLPNPPPAVSWSISIDNINATGLTVSRNGLNIDGAASNITLAQNQGVTILTDGTNYFSQRGIGGSSTTVPFNNILSGTNTAASMIANSGSNLSPSGSAGLAAQQIWIPPYLVAPTISFATTGGSIVCTHASSVVYVLNNSAGHTVQSQAANGGNSTFGCSTGTAAVLTVTSPTTPQTVGYTVWSVYVQDCGATPCGGSEALQTACTNLSIGTNCVLSSYAGGGALPTVGSAYVQPPNVQQSTCQNGGVPWLFGQDNSGNYQPWSVIDQYSNNSVTTGYLEFCRPIRFMDYNTLVGVYAGGTHPIIPGNNAFVLIDHLWGQNTSSSNQDRALWVNVSNATNDAASHYAMEGIQVEVDPAGTPTVTGSPDGELSAISAQMGFYITSNVASNSFGSNVLRATFFRQASAAVDTQGMNGLNVSFVNQSTVSGGNQFVDGMKNICSSSTAVTGLICSNITAIGGTATNPFTQYNVLYLPFASGWSPRGTADYGVRNDNYNLQWMLGGPTYVTTLNSSDSANLGINGDTTLTGSLTTAQQSGPAISSATCSGGASQYTYQLVGIDTNGGAVAGSAVNTSGGSVCVNPLTAGNPVTINTALNSALVMGLYSRIDVYRTAGPMGTGKIGNITVTGGGGTWTCTHSTISNNFVCGPVKDTGLVADGGTPPSVNTTSGLGTPANAVSHLVGNLFQVGSSGFTTANNTSLQTITGLVFNLSQTAANYSFHCALSWSQGTGNAAVAFGIQTATAAATNVFANGTEQITVGPPATFVTGTLATLASTSATTIVSGTPTATATNYVTTLDGTIEEPVNDAGQVVNIMVSTATGTDPVTVLRGSYCRLY